MSKSSNLVKKTCSIALIALFILSAFATVPLVLAQPSLTLNPTSGPLGTIVTITGNGFTSGTYYRVYFDTNNNERYDYGEPYRTVSGPAFTTTLTIPSVPSGTYYIRADAYPYYPPAIASAPFIVRTVWEKLLDIQDEISDIQAKLESGGSFYTFVNNWFETIETTISDSVATITNAISGAVTTLQEDISSAVSSIKSAISTSEGVITTAISNAQSAIISEINANELKIDAVKSVVDSIKTEVTAIEGKLDALPTFGDLVTKSWNDLTDYIDSAKNEILSAISDLKTQLEEKLDYIIAKPDFRGDFTGSYAEDPAFNPSTGNYTIAVNSVTGSGSGTIDTTSVSFTFEGYLVSDWGHYNALNNGSLVTGRLNITTTNGDQIHIEINGMQHEVWVDGKYNNVNRLTGTYTIITGTGAYKGATGSGTIVADINTNTRSFTGSFKGIIKY